MPSISLKNVSLTGKQRIYKLPENTQLVSSLSLRDYSAVMLNFKIIALSHMLFYILTTSYDRQIIK